MISFNINFASLSQIKMTSQYKFDQAREMMKLRCTLLCCQTVSFTITILFFVTTLVCALVAIINQDMFMTTIFLFIFGVYMFTTFLFLLLDELNKESSTEHSPESEIYTIPVDDEPAPSYEALFGMNTSPPPYEIATKENWKEMMNESLTIICLE